jgi:hypothetical protein
MNHQINTEHLAELAVALADDGLAQTGETIKQAAEVIEKLTYQNTCLEALVQSLEKELGK